MSDSGITHAPGCDHKHLPRQKCNPPKPSELRPAVSQPTDPSAPAPVSATVRGLGPLFEYMAESQWAGWFSRYGSEHLITHTLNMIANDGWRLVQVERFWALWFWLIPRPKLLYVFERNPREAVEVDGDGLPHPDP